jgi:hypothetical protein
MGTGGKEMKLSKIRAQLVEMIISGLETGKVGNPHGGMEAPTRGSSKKETALEIEGVVIHEAEKTLKKKNQQLSVSHLADGR